MPRSETNIKTTELLVATSNPHKLQELRAIFEPLGIRAVGLDSLGRQLPEPFEDGSTFEENAAKKALSYAFLAERVCLADDSGLEVDALKGEPGVQSAVWAGRGSTRAERDAANNLRLMCELDGVGPEHRAARYVCCMCIGSPDGKILATARGEWSGRVTTGKARGRNGFGYDALIEMPDGRTVAEMNEAEKNEQSHRARAARAIAARVVETLRGK
ncbi:MAG: non-canonical purine NTP pyrophosphatase [Phycisphaerales bacterium]